MKRIDIDRIFANLVAEKIADGYVINTNTMGGTQGELAKVDLKKGDEFLRIHLEHHIGISDYSTHYIIIIGKSPKAVGDSRHEIVWTQELEEVARYVFWQIGENWFTGIEEYAKECFGKRRARAKARYAHIDRLTGYDINLPVASHKLALERVRRICPRCKSVKLSDIKRITKVTRGETKEWVVVVRDHVWTLGRVNIA